MDSATLNNKMTLNNRVIITTPILWLGFVLSISFMEAWLKFQAEGVTQLIGLNIGKLIFFALNKVELFFMIILSVTILSDGHFTDTNLLSTSSAESTSRYDYKRESSCGFLCSFLLSFFRSLKSNRSYYFFTINIY